MRKSILSLFVSLLLPAAAMAQLKLCGNVVDASGWSGNVYTDPYGIYSFDASDANLTLNSVAQSRSLNGNGGGVADDKDVYLYCGVEIEDNYASGKVYKFSQTDFDGKNSGYVSGLYQVPTALTWDASTGNYYGCFYKNDNDGFEFGVASLSSGRPSRTKIGTLKERLVAMADNDAGVVYAIGLSGKLYTVNTESGALTEIGNTGVTPANMIQSACYADGCIYWAAQTGKRQSALYKVDPATAVATKIGDFPKGEQFSVLYPFKAAAEDGAPAKIEKMTANFEGPSLTGSVSFTMPAKTFAGGDLSGELTWTLQKDDNVLATGKADAGTVVTVPELTLENDYNTLEVYTANEVGKSPVYKEAFFVGPDTPSAIAWGGATLTVDDQNKATVTWSPSESGINGGYFVPEEVKYNVVRMPGEVKVAQGIKETSFSEQLPDAEGIVTYYYSITPVFMGNEGYSSETNKVNVGSGYEIPFAENFDDGALDRWTVLDLNDDYTTWWLNSGYVYSQAGYDGGSNDWLISPQLHLVPGKYYKVSFKYWGGLPDYTEYAGNSFEVGFGKGTDPATFQIVGSKSGVILAEENAKTFSAVVKVDEDGYYNFGIHDTSSADAYAIYVDDFSVVEGGTLQVPAPISDFSAVADADGALKVELSFTAPSTTAEGKPLTDLQKIEIVRDEKDTVKTFEAPKAGEKFSFADTDATGLTDGSHHYSIHSVNGKGQSLDAETDVKVGIAAPGATTDLVAEEKEDGIHLTWNAPTVDADGNAVNPENYTYTIAAMKYYTQEVVIVADDVKGTSYVDNKTLDADGDQLQVYYMVQAKNRAGVGLIAESNQFVVGKSYSLPMTEGFSPEYDRQSKYLWWIDLSQDINTMSFFRFGTGMSSDGDDGCAVFFGAAENSFSNLRSGKISFAGTEKPQISYDYYMEYDGEAKLSVEYSADLKTWTQLDCLDMSTVHPEEAAWMTHTLDATPCVAYPYVYIRLHGECIDGYTPIYVDNINIKESSVSSIDNAAVSADNPVDIYTVAGQLVRRNATTTKGLAPGLYVVNGKKMFVDR